MLYRKEGPPHALKRKKTIIIGGVIVMICGIVFHLQGQSLIGPETSFMYSNPKWQEYGIWIFILGILIVIAGIVINLFKKN